MNNLPLGSPLIAPGVCSLVVVAPAPRDLASLGHSLRVVTRHNLMAITLAANIANVPTFVFSIGLKLGTHAFAREFRDIKHKEFLGEAYAIPWQSTSFKNALAEEDRYSLVLAGFWLEHQIIATALHALADSYDVYVSMDASPARVQPAAPLSHDRLIQAGATPVATSQIIHEWSLELPGDAERAALNPFLQPRANEEEE